MTRYLAGPEPSSTGSGTGTTVGQLAMKSEAEMLKYRNFGKKSLNEIKDKLLELGLNLGMKIDPDLIDQPFTAGVLGAPEPAAPAGGGLADLIEGNIDD